MRRRKPLALLGARCRPQMPCYPKAQPRIGAVFARTPWWLVMGEATVRNKWAKEPPADSSTLSGLLDDWRWKVYSGQLHDDPCIEFTKDAPDLATAIERACASRGANGEYWHHQRPYKAHIAGRSELARILTTRSTAIEAVAERGRFRDLLELVEDAGKDVAHVGKLTLYDVAMRLSYFLGVEMDAIYPHAGVAKGLAALGLPTSRPVQREELPPTLALCDDLNEVEDFLCSYRAPLSELSDYQKENG